MGMPTKKEGATEADLQATPDDVRAELIDGVLYTMPPPRAVHQLASGYIHGDLDGPFQRGRGGPGGWWILAAPGVRTARSTVVPDVAGWRKERLPSMPRKIIEVVPDWVCEVLSPSTRAYDLRTKAKYYARIGVPFHWLVDVDARTLVARRLFDGKWMELDVWGHSDKVRAEPFADVELDLATWWEGMPPPLKEAD